MNLKLKKIVVALIAVSVLSLAAAPARADDFDAKVTMGLGVVGVAAGVPIAGVLIPWGAWEYFHPSKADPTLAFEPMAAADVSIDHQKELANLLTNYAQKRCTDTGGQPMRWETLNSRDYRYSLDHAEAAVRDENSTISMTNMPGNEHRFEDSFAIHMRMQAVEAGKAHVGLTCVKDDAYAGQGTIHHGYSPIEVWAEKSDGKVHIRAQDTSYNAPRYSKTLIVDWDVIEKAAAGVGNQSKRLDF